MTIEVALSDEDLCEILTALQVDGPNNSVLVEKLIRARVDLARVEANIS